MHASRIWILILLGAATPLPLVGQEPPDQLPPLLPEEREIALARSAAPPEVSRDATVLVLRRGGYAVAREGTNGVTCYVSRTHVESLEPHCFDEEGSATILRIHLRQAELREQGVAEDQIDRRVSQEIREGTLRLPRRPVLSYMMSAGQVLYNGDRRVGAWKPHLMIYYPYLSAGELGLPAEYAPQAPMLFDGGAADASLVIVVPDFVDPEQFVSR